MSLPLTQKAVALPGKRLPYIEVSAPVYAPEAGEIVVRVHWTVSTPLDLHRADGGILIPSWPAQTGSGGAAGTVVAVGSGGNLRGLRLGDEVAVFAFRGGKEANHQEYIIIPSYLAMKLPQGITMQEAVTLNNNFVTAVHTITVGLQLELPWPIPQDWKPKEVDQPILVWGASSNVGLFVVQVLRHWGYKNVLTVSSSKHHDYLKSIGANSCFNYEEGDVVHEILEHVKSQPEPKVPFIVDCIGSIQGTLEPIARIAQNGSTVAVMLPIVLKNASDDEEPEYEMDIANAKLDWAEAVTVHGVRTHFYLQNEFFKENLQSEILPALLAQGVLRPNKQRIVEGETMVERAQNALVLLRNRNVSGERLIWRIAEE